MLLTVRTTVVGDSVVIHALGEIDLDTADQLRGPLDAAVASTSRRVVVDLSEAAYLDSTGLGVLLGAHKQLLAAGRGLVQRTSQSRILRVPKLASLTRVLTIESDAGRVSSTPGVLELGAVTA